MDKFCECIPKPETGLLKEDDRSSSSLPLGPWPPRIPLIPDPVLALVSGLSGLLVAGELKLVFLEWCTPWMTDVCL